MQIGKHLGEFLLLILIYSETFGVSDLTDDSLQLQMVLDLIRHHWKVLLPGQLALLEIDQKVQEGFYIVSRTEFTSHKLVI